MRATNTTRLSAISAALVASVITMLMSGQVLAEEENVVWDHMDVPYGVDDPARQFLNIYLADTTEPAPVYLFSHDNSKTAYDFLQNDADNVHDQGYTLVSWESIVQLNSNPQSILTAWSDAQVAFDWVRANATTYNMDPDRIVIAGRSRGSIASWPLAHSGHAAIQGIYMYNALPNSIWTQEEAWSPVNEVNAASPPIYMVYNPTPGDGNPHAPENAYKIRAAYAALSIDDTFTTYDSMSANGFSSINHYFPEFLASLEPSGPPANMVDDFEGSNTTYPWTENGAWYTGGGTYNQDEIIGAYSAYAGNPAWDDYTFEADMITVNSLNPAKAWMANSLAFRVSGEQNMYVLRLHSNGALRLRSVVNSVNTIIASVATDYSPFAWHSYKIEVSNDSIKASIDDELLIDISDSDHPTGYIGITTNQSSASVDNVRVTQPPGC